MKLNFDFLFRRIMRNLRDRFTTKKVVEYNKNTVDFVKLCGEWYADIENWKYDLHNLTMVMGADKLLDYLSGNTKFVSLIVSTTNNGGVRLEKLDDEYEGATYKVCDDNCPVREIWLCQVNNIFWGGDAPDTIYFKVNHAHPNVNQGAPY